MKTGGNPSSCGLKRHHLSHVRTGPANHGPTIREDEVDIAEIPSVILFL